VKLNPTYLIKFPPQYLRHLQEGLVGALVAVWENKENVVGGAVDVDEYT